MPTDYTRKPPNVKAVLYDGFAQDLSISRNEILNWLTEEFLTEPTLHVEYNVESDSLYYYKDGDGFFYNVFPNTYVVKDANGNIFTQDRVSFEALYDKVVT